MDTFGSALKPSGPLHRYCRHLDDSQAIPGAQRSPHRPQCSAERDRSKHRVAEPFPPQAVKPGGHAPVSVAVAVDGDVAVATGSSTYLSGPGGPVEKAYDNCFVMRFDSAGRCREFTEWYVERPSG